MREAPDRPEPPERVREIQVEEQVERWYELDQTPLEDFPEELREIIRRRHDHQ